MALSKLEKRLGYTFRQREILRQALTHRSAAAVNNERLEFLGDAGLGFVVADLLYHLHLQVREHQLTIMRASLVNKGALAERARELDLGAFLKLGGSELSSGGQHRDSILADAMEAVLGAVYLDGGYNALAAVISARMSHVMKNLTPENSQDPKTKLQERMQAKHAPLPEYVVVLRQGKDHNRVYDVECRIGEPEMVTRGRATSRRQAEKLAATEALSRLEKSGE